MKMIHDSRCEKYRTPMGAQPCNSQIRLFIETDATEALVRFWHDDTASIYTMKPAKGGFEYTFTLPEKPGILWYYFICDGKFYGNAPDNLGGLGAESAGEPPSFMITVYDPAYTTPEWMGDGIMLQIFPDRFERVGDTPIHGFFHENWNDDPSVFVRNGKMNSESDFFGGNLQGIISKLDYIKSLGVTVIYLNPIFMSSSNHRYNTSDYMQIDPTLGTEEDLKELCAKAMEMGIRVILDGVFSHTGSDSLYFNQYRNFPGPGAYNSRKSKYYSWFMFDHWPDDYKSWWGFETLPTVDKNSKSFRKFIYEGKDSVCAHWMKCGISGWRLDVADELPMDFIAGFRERMRKENPDSALIGEVWEDPSRKVAYGKLRSYCLGDTLDSTMNYPIRDAILGFFLNKFDADTCARMIASIYENTPVPFHRSVMNLLGSHDRPRVLSLLAEAGNMAPHWRQLKPIKLSNAQYELGKKRLISAWRMICALPGIPCIYYGDEAGMYGMTDPFCRGTYPWGNEDTDLVEEFRKTALFRHANPVLKKGDMKIEAVGRDALRITRTFSGDAMTLTVNRNAEMRNIFGIDVPGYGAEWTRHSHLDVCEIM